MTPALTQRIQLVHPFFRALNQQEKIWHLRITNSKRPSLNSCFEGAAFVVFFAFKNSHLQGLLCLRGLNSI